MYEMLIVFTETRDIGIKIIILNFLTSSKCLVRLFNKCVTSYKSCLAVGYFLKGIKEADVNDELNGHQARAQKRGIIWKQ